MPTSWFDERRRADSLERALERYERLVASGTDPSEAFGAAGASLWGETARLFEVSVGLRRRKAAVPRPSFGPRFEERLRSIRFAPSPAPQRRGSRTPHLVTLAAAACVIVLAGLLFSASRSLPGDALYGLKRTAESAQLGLASGPAEARIHLALAQTRFDEVDGLISRAHNQVVGVPGTTMAAAFDDVADPKLAALIKDTIAEAEHQVLLAAAILIDKEKSPTSGDELGRLAVVAHQGSKTATNAAADMSSADRPPVLVTAKKLARVAASAERAQALSQEQDREPEVTCATASPSTTPSTDATPSPEESSDPEATSSTTPESADPATTVSPEATATPSDDPCATVTPPPGEPNESPAISPSPEPTAQPDGGAPATDDPNSESGSPTPSA